MIRGNRQGFSLVGELIAAAMVLVAVGGICAITKISFDSYRRIRSITLMFERETLIINSLSDPATLLCPSAAPCTSPNLTALRTLGAVPAGSTLQTVINGQNQIIASFGSATWLSTRSGSTYATPCTAGAEDCDISVQVGINCSSQDNISTVHYATSAYNVCSASYRVTASGNIIPLGESGKINDPFANFSIPVAFEATSRSVASDSAQLCDSSTNRTFATGFDKATGQLFCAQPSSIICAADQIATNVQFSLPNNSLDLQCQSLRSIGCPSPNYSLQTLTVASLHPQNGSASQGQCVFIGAHSQAWENLPAPGTSISFRCPANYTIQSANPCQVNTVNSTPGTCYSSCNCNAYGRNCESCATTVDAIPGTASPISVSGDTASCSLNVPTQPCGATWTGTVSMTSGVCALVPPDNIPAAQ